MLIDLSDDGHAGGARSDRTRAAHILARQHVDQRPQAKVRFYLALQGETGEGGDGCIPASKRAASFASADCGIEPISMVLRGLLLCLPERRRALRR